MDTSYCEKFGFEAGKIRARLAMLGLGDGDKVLARRLQDKVIRPNLDEITGQFYRILLQHDEFVSILSSSSSLDNLKSTQRQYLLSLGLNFGEQSYFEGRLKVGMAHVWVGVSLPMYQCAYRILQQLLVDHIPESSGKKDILISFILKITTLDMTLATEAYHNARVLGLEQNLENLQNQAESLQAQLEKDSLTQILSRSSINRILTDIAQGRRTESICLIMADLDYFKQVNDNYGHLVGDDVLRDVAGRIHGSLRHEDAVGRYGGEEFLIVLAGADLKGGKEIAERIRTRIDSNPFHSSGFEIDVAISQGLIKIRPGESVSEMIRRADEALYQAKHNGRNRVEVGE